MYALDNKSGIKQMPEIPEVFSQTPLWFTEGRDGNAPSYPGAHWFNIVQAELLNVLKEAGIEPDKADLTQLAQAFRVMAGQVESIAALREFEPVRDRQVAFVKGYYAGSNKGGGYFIADFADTTSEDNGGTVIVTAGGKRWKRLNQRDGLYFASEFGLIGDLSSRDTQTLTSIKSNNNVKLLDCEGKTFAISEYSGNNRKFANGYFKLSSEPDLIPMSMSRVIQTGNGLIAIGHGAGANDERMRNCIAIGQDALHSNRLSRHNIAIGISALHYLDGGTASGIDGTRNIAIGGNAGRFATTASRNIILGRDSAHALVAGHLNVVIGNAAMMGDCPNTLTYGEIINQTPTNATRNIVIGQEASMYVKTSNTIAIGYHALQNNRESAGMVGIGVNAFEKHEADRSYWDTEQYETSLSGTYTQNNSKTITVTVANHGLQTDYKVWLRFTSGALYDVSYADDIWFDVTVIDTNTFTIQSSENTTASGNCSFSKVSTTSVYAKAKTSGQSVGVGYNVGNGNNNFRSVGVGYNVGGAGLGSESTGVGYNALGSKENGGSNTAIGAYSQASLTTGANANTALGVLSLNALETGSNNIAIGASAMREVTNSIDNIAIGSNALRTASGTRNNVALGASALRYSLSSNDAHTYSNCVGLGYATMVNGDNQVALGNSKQTCYAYQPLQTRSDARDKIDIRDTQLGLDFINQLRPVDYRWNYRDDYVQIDGNGNLIKLKNDGSKARMRFHHGFIAQDVAEVIQKTGIDFGGYQDASINGGADVKSIAYEELISPLVKAVQELHSKVQVLELAQKRV